LGPIRKMPCDPLAKLTVSPVAVAGPTLLSAAMRLAADTVVEVEAGATVVLGAFAAPVVAGDEEDEPQAARPVAAARVSAPTTHLDGVISRIFMLQSTNEEPKMFNAMFAGAPFGAVELRRQSSHRPIQLKMAPWAGRSPARLVYGAEAIPTIGPFRWVAPMDPSKGASPNEKTPPSPAASQ
jgi:hypothetical protein